MSVSVLVASCVSDNFYISYTYRLQLEDLENLEIQTCLFPERKSINGPSGWSEILGITFMI